MEKSNENSIVGIEYIVCYINVYRSGIYFTKRWSNKYSICGNPVYFGDMLYSCIQKIDISCLL